MKANRTIKSPNLFKWWHYQAKIIVPCLRWYLGYSLSCRDFEKMMRERGLKVDHSTLARWDLAFTPKLEKRIKAQFGFFAFDTAQRTLSGYETINLWSVESYDQPVSMAAQGRAMPTDRVVDLVNPPLTG